jgi:ribose 5-phosphate isomerase RpiB
MRIHIGSDHAGLELKNMAHLSTTHLMITQSFVFQQPKQQLLNQALLA